MSIGFSGSQSPGVYRGAMGENTFAHKVDEGDPYAVEREKRGSFARFTEKAVLNEIKSETSGTPIYDKEVHVEIFSPADPQNIPCRRVRSANGELIGKEWTTYYAKEWAAFCAGEVQSPDGTPLSEWPGCDVAIKATLNALHIVTVEQLADAADVTISKIPHGGRDLQAKARAFVLVGKERGAAMQLAAIAEKANRERDEMAARLADIEKRLANFSAAQQAVSDVAPQASVQASVLAPEADPIREAALMSGASPVTATDLASFQPGRRGPGRPPKNG